MTVKLAEQQAGLFGDVFLLPAEMKQEVATMALKTIVDGLESRGCHDSEKLAAMTKDVIAIVKASLPNE